MAMLTVDFEQTQTNPKGSDIEKGRHMISGHYPLRNYPFPLKILAIYCALPFVCYLHTVYTYILPFLKEMYLTEFRLFAIKQDLDSHRVFTP